MVQLSSEPKVDEKTKSRDNDESNGRSNSSKRKSEGGSAESGEGSKKKRRKSKHSRRRLSVSKPARDPRDEATPTSLDESAIERSPSPVIDFDGLSRPSTLHML